MSQAPIRAAIYARTATSQELTPSFALAEQIQMCKKYVLGKGYVLVEDQVYQEIASGATENRPMLHALLQLAQENKFDVLIILDFARLARRETLCINLITRFEQAGVTVETITEQPFEIPLLQLLQICATQIEREKLAARTQYGKRVAREQKEQ
jgi:DNA invertase Pin-like site-specific DNA recombinase